MTLGFWFRDYVYIPLGGNRVGKWKLARNLFVVWLLTGLWHGAAWTFVVWGLCYATLIAIEKLVGERLLARMGKWGWLWTFTAVVMLWVLFRSESLGNAWSYWKGMFGAGQGSWVDINVGYQLLEYGGWLTVATALCLDWRHLLSWAKRRLPRASLAAREIGVLVVLMLVVARLANDTFRPFLYFNF
jgi:alginate O-acetyltransferase complex protein AlgI